MEHNWLSLDNEENIILTTQCSGSTGIKAVILHEMNIPFSLAESTHYKCMSISNNMMSLHVKTIEDHSKLHLILRNPLNRFYSACKVWKVRFPMEKGFDRLLDYVEAGCDEGHISPIVPHIKGRFSQFKERMFFYRIEEAEKWEDVLGFKCPHYAHKPALFSLMTEVQIERFNILFSEDIELYETLKFPGNEN